MDSIVSLKEAPLSQMNYKKATTNHNSCSSMATFHSSFGSIIDDEPYDCGDCSFVVDQQQLAKVCEDWLQKNQYPTPAYLQHTMAQLKPDFDRLEQMSMTSIMTEDYEGGNESMSFFMAKHGQESNSSLACDPHFSNDCQGAMLEEETAESKAAA